MNRILSKYIDFAKLRHFLRPNWGTSTLQPFFIRIPHTKKVLKVKSYVFPYIYMFLVFFVFLIIV